MEKGWTKIFISKDSNIINLIVSVLEKDEISAVSINKRDSSYTVFGHIEIYVQDNNIEQSKKIINIYNKEKS